MKGQLKPIVIVSSWPPRKCGIATFAEEAHEFISKHQPERPTCIISHTDGRGENVFPIINEKRKDWYKVVARKIKELDPYVVHLEHEYGLYNYVNRQGVSDNNEGFLNLLKSLKGIPTVVEPHTVHGRMREHEEQFIKRLAKLCNVLLFKCHYQKWRLEWTSKGNGWASPKNIMIIPHGARADKKYAIDEVPALKSDLGLDSLQGRHVVGLVGWIQRNKRWDILTSMWEELHNTIKSTTGEDWVLLAAGQMRDPNDQREYEKYVGQVDVLQDVGIAHFYEFEPRGDIYYKVMAVCDFIVLPSLDETQSGTLARIIALNKPYITTAPMEGLTAQTLESGGGMLFTTKKMLREHVIRLATDESLRWTLGHKLYKYLIDVVDWNVVAGQYYQAYEMANAEIHDGVPVEFPAEF